jgi:hypothetical protein
MTEIEGVATKEHSILEMTRNYHASYAAAEKGGKGMA